MPAASRLGDLCTGHDCYPPRPSTGASGDVYINGIGAHRQGDGWASHCCGPACHASALSGGSGSVFVNGQPLGRIGDAVGCGSVVAQGSPSVFAGG